MAEGIQNHDLIHRKSRYDYFEEELRFIQKQTHLSLKRNAVESFSYLKSKADTCRRYKYSLKLVYGCIEEFIKKQRTEIQNDFKREDYMGGSRISEELNETFVVRALEEKSQTIKDYISRNKTVFENYENELHTSQFDMPMRTVDAIHEYLREMRKLHRLMDTILDIYQKVHKRAMVCRNAIVLLDSIKYDDMIKAGRQDEISGLPITVIELFKDDEILTVKVKVKDRGRTEQLKVTLETSKFAVDLSLLELQLYE